MKAEKKYPELKQKYEKLGYIGNDTLLDKWNWAVNNFGAKEFVSDDKGQRYTYTSLDSAADALAAYLQAAEIGAGDVVTLQIPPRSEFVISVIACLKIGAVPAPLGMCFVGDELKGLLDRFESKFHICTGQYRGADREEMLENVMSSRGLDKALLFVEEAFLTDPKPHERCFEKAVFSGKKPESYYRGSAEDITLILCTSGTTMGSKGVMFSHSSIIFSETVFNEALGLNGDDAIFMPAPLSHATGFHHGIISPMLVGGRLVLQEKFCCKEAIEIMNREKCTYSMGATPFIYDILNQLEESGDWLPHMRFYICGGAPVPAKLVSRGWTKFGIRICECYGSTESVPHVCVRPEDCLNNAGRSAGKPMRGIEVRIVDKDRKPVPAGTVGEEASRGPNMFSGYINAPELTDAVLDDDGWFYSGDLAVMDDDGNVQIVGRIKDLIVRGGENLNSNQINENLEGCPLICDHAIIGMPDERLGERICAFVVPCDGIKAISKNELIEYLKSKKVHKRYWPERVELINEIPRTESGKVKKNLLAKELERRMKAGG